MAVDHNIALLRHAFQALQAKDLDACERFLREDFIANLPGLPHPLHGRAIWRLGVQAMIDGFSDLRVDIEDIFGADDKVAVRLRFHGTHDGLFQEIPPTHRQVSFTSVEIYRVQDDKIAEEWVSPDMMGLMGQISAPAAV